MGLPQLIQDSVELGIVEIETPGPTAGDTGQGRLGEILGFIAEKPGKPTVTVRCATVDELDGCARAAEQYKDKVTVALTVDLGSVNGCEEAALRALRDVCKRKPAAVAFFVDADASRDAAAFMRKAKLLYLQSDCTAQFVLTGLDATACASRELVELLQRESIPHRWRPGSPYVNSAPHKLDALLCGPCPVAGKLKVQRDGLVSFCPYRQVGKGEPLCVGDAGTGQIRDVCSKDHALTVQRLLTMTIGPLPIMFLLMRTAEADLASALPQEVYAVVKALYDQAADRMNGCLMPSMVLNRSASDRIKQARDLHGAPDVIGVKSICDICSLCNGRDLNGLLMRHCDQTSLCNGVLVWQKTTGKQYLRSEQVKALAERARCA